MTEETKEELAVEEPENELSQEEPAGEVPKEPDPEPEDDFEAKRAKWQEKVDKRIAKLTAQKHQEAEARKKAEDRIKELENINKAYESQTKLQKEEPKRDDFDDEDEFFKALSQWNYKMGRAQEKHQEATERFQKMQEEPPPPKQQQTHPLQDAFDEGTAKYNDFKDVVMNNMTNPIFNTPAAQAVVDILADSENAHDVLYYLGKHEDEGSRLSRLSLPAIAREIGRIEARLIDKPKKTTKAPPPLKPVAGAEPATQDLDPDKDPIAWIKARNEGKI